MEEEDEKKKKIGRRRMMRIERKRERKNHALIFLVGICDGKTKVLLEPSRNFHELFLLLSSSL
jgi:hypothetical protein